MPKSVISLAPIPSQTFTVVLDGQNVQIRLRQLRDALYMDASSDSGVLFCGFRCQNKRNLLISSRSPVSGRIFFIDTQGDKKPSYEGLGSRFFLVYEK